MNRNQGRDLPGKRVATVPLIRNPETLRTIRQNKVNLLYTLNPATLARALDAFERGHLREVALLWEWIAERDDTLASVKPKREKDVSQLSMQIVVPPGAGDEGDRHRMVLERFWRSVKATNVYDLNERGGVRRLIKQMMSAVSYRYAAHHIIWQPTTGGDLRATFEFVPVWMFENTSGTLRYQPNASGAAGEELAESEWMVTTGEGLMIACSIGYMAKRSAFNDWLIFSEKFAVPGVLGRTTAKKGSPEAIAMRTAVEAFGHDWTGVIYGDDGTHKKPIELVEAVGSPLEMPMPAVVDRVDRRIAALYRGADLSSMSAQGSNGRGASVQGKETATLRRDDAEMIAETLGEVSRFVIKWYFGPTAEPLANLQLVDTSSEDFLGSVESGILLAGQGARVSAGALMARARIPAVRNDDDVLGAKRL